MDCSAEYSLACLILEKKKAVLAALLLEEEEDAERKRKQRLQIPRSVWNISTEDDATDADFEAFVRATMQFNRDEFTNVVSYVDDIPLSLKHHGIHAISCTQNVRSIIGLSLEEFGDVFLLFSYNVHRHIFVIFLLSGISYVVRRNTTTSQFCNSGINLACQNMHIMTGYSDDLRIPFWTIMTTYRFDNN